MSPLALRALADAAEALARLARAAAEDSPSPEEMLSEAEAAQIAKCSVRTLRNARRSGALAVYGSQRSRTVRRVDLVTWIESRRAPIVAGADDGDIAARMRRLAKSRRTTKAGAR